MSTLRTFAVIRSLTTTVAKIMSKMRLTCGQASVLNDDSRARCKRRTNFVPPSGRGSVGFSADPSQTQTGASSSMVDGISSVGFQPTAAALAHGSSAQRVQNWSAV